MKIWSNKFFQSVVFAFITISFGIVLSKLGTLKIVLEQTDIVTDRDIANILIKDIKDIKIIGAIIWATTIGLYNNFIRNINENKNSSDTTKL